ncbi:hypothetical protein [Streptomyces sp. L2]|uniref:hypothetical protein n=1 Tax=Streptomyces sp. L2 TaxID=2162665 RepID=UPI001010BC52|nr:hypothetical protein [Streptomyces sp. L2]
MGQPSVTPTGTGAPSVSARPSGSSGDARPTLAEGTELVGEFEGSGYREPPQLVARSDGQLVRLPGLLYTVAKLLDRHSAPDGERPGGGGPTVAHIAAALSEETGRLYTADHVTFLVDQKLAPLGITTYCDGSPPPPVAKADPFLAFRFRMAVLSEEVTWFLAGLFAWLHRPVVALLAVPAFFAGEVWFWMQDTAGALQAVLFAPTSFLLVVFLAVVSCVFHEMGHASACRYGGVRPGSMGCGVYLVWPAFYTDITNSYRLGRGGRLRADLGGVYFNAVFANLLVLAYLTTGFSPLLVAILSVNLEIFQQLLPTLRFDGYYIIADLVGIPDLFKYIGPIIRSVLFRKPRDERLQALKRWPQAVVTVWVVCVVPALALQLGYVVMQLPRLIQVDWQQIQVLVVNAAASGDYVMAGASAVQILLLILPVAGLTVVVMQLLRGVFRFARRRLGSSEAMAGKVVPAES